MSAQVIAAVDSARNPLWPRDTPWETPNAAGGKILAWQLSWPGIDLCT